MCFSPFLALLFDSSSPIFLLCLRSWFLIALIQATLKVFFKTRGMPRGGLDYVFPAR